MSDLTCKTDPHFQPIWDIYPAVGKQSDLAKSRRQTNARTLRKRRRNSSKTRRY